VSELRNAPLSCKAPATSREVKVLRMAFDLAVVLGVAFPVERDRVLSPPALPAGVWTVTDRLPRELGAPDERDVADLAMT